MDEELIKMLNLKDEYVPGSEAPQILPQPEQKPVEAPQPEPLPKKRPKPKEKQPTYLFSTILTIAGILVVSAFAFFLLTREVAIQAQRDEISAIRTTINEMYSQRDELITSYNSSLNILDIRTRAENFGMHAPAEGQVVCLTD